MSSLAAWPIHIDKIELTIVAVIVAVLGIVVAWQKWFARNAEAWPTIEARVENVFLDVSSRGPNHPDVTHTVLAYAYSIRDCYYSGQVRLEAGEVSLESVEREMVGKKISVHCNPGQPEISIFLRHKVGGWLVVADRRTSLWSWFD